MSKFAYAAVAAVLASLPGVAAAQSFDGPYVGAQAGWNHDDVNHVRTDVGKLDGSADRDAFVGGVFAGYDKRVAPRIVLGVEGGFELAADDRVRGAAYSIDPHYSFDATARAGYLVNDQTLLYVRGGYANSRARVRTVAATDVKTFDGWTLGAGVERVFLPHVSGRLEYRYSDLSSSGRYDRHQLLAGVAYRF